MHFIPVQLHPFFKKWADLPENQCPRSLELYPRLVSLPLYPAMTEEEVKYVAQSVREIVQNHAKPVVTAGATWNPIAASGLLPESAQ